jgi:hypothetical protein
LDWGKVGSPYIHRALDSEWEVELWHQNMSHSWKAKSCSLTQEFPQYVMKSERSLPCSQQPVIILYPGSHESSPYHTIPSYFFKNHFNSILPSTSRSSKWSLSFIFSNHTSALHFSHACYMPCPSHLIVLIIFEDYWEN